ncbi:MAG: MarR family transcriptional regulator [Gammaproteobacteria bacterium]|nr:MAG: MarR family transcriptional regulator [Gammaproteobacteria bacterium]
MSKDLINQEVTGIYALWWRLVQLSVHRYGSHPTGEMLMVLTIVLLDEAGYQPTVTELARLVGLPKSTVSRYVASQMSEGFVEECIDPADRRRRRLGPTRAARAERAWHLQQLRAIQAQTFAIVPAGGFRGAAAEEMLELLRSFAAEGPNEAYDFDGAESAAAADVEVSGQRFDADVAMTCLLEWRLVDLAVQRYGSAPTTALLVVLTLVLLDDVGYSPTVTELAEIAGLPKSTVSRHCAEQMGAGYLTEIIDPADRRRRRLQATASARRERRWLREAIERLLRDTGASVHGQRPPSERSADEVLGMLRAFVAERPVPPAA